MTAVMISIRLFVATLPLALLVSCGGESFRGDEEEQGGDGGTMGGRAGQGGGAGTGQGGTGAAGSGSGGSSLAGTGFGGNSAGFGGTGFAGTGFGGNSYGGSFAGAGAGGTGGFAGTCTAYPFCQAHEYAVTDPAYCEVGGGCRQVSLCGATIWCTTPTICNGYPSCDEGDFQLSGACPPGGSCYERTSCGLTITCLVAECYPPAEYNRVYYSEEGCNTLDEPCTLPNTNQFENACGCGCEQDPSCPQHLYCVHPNPPQPEAREAPADSAQDPAEPRPPDGAAPLPYCDLALLERCPFSEFYIF
jgi:hypothetical protein